MKILISLQSDDVLPAEALAQVGHIAREEAEGKEIWEKLQAEELLCEDLTDENFGALGEYFMFNARSPKFGSGGSRCLQLYILYYDIIRSSFYTLRNRY